MGYTPIQLPLRTNQARDTAAGSAKLVNCYSTPIGEDSKAASPVYACDGWSSFSTLTSGGVTRGMINLNDSLLWVMSGGNLYSVTTGGTATNRASVATSGTAYFARNRAATPDIMMVTSDGLTRTISGTTVTTPSYHADIDSNLFNSVCQHDGYFVITKSDGEFYITGIDNVAIDALDFAKASTYADGLVRGLPRGRDIALAGSSSIEFWQNTGNADFPYQRVHVANFGTYAAPAMVNVVAVVDSAMVDTIIWPATDPAGGFAGVFMLGGYDARKISNWEVDNAIRTATKSAIRAYAYPSQGDTFYCITDAATFSYEFNCRTGAWHQRKGSGLNFAQTVDACVFNNSVIFGDYTSGLLYQQSTAGVPGSASLVSLRTSKNNGTTWTTARTKAVGTSSNRAQRAKFTALGQSREDGFQLELKITNAYVEGSNAIDATVIPPAVHATPFPIQMHALYVDHIPGVSGTANQKGMLQLGVDITKVGA